MKVYQVITKTYFKYETKYYGEKYFQVNEFTQTYKTKRNAEEKFYWIAEKQGVNKTDINMTTNPNFEYKWLDYKNIVNLTEIEVII